jgi:hypothetical protein
MAQDRSFEQVASAVNSLNKTQLKDRLLHFKGRYKFDFTEAYLEASSVDKLRHILVAAMLKTT